MINNFKCFKNTTENFSHKITHYKTFFKLCDVTSFTGNENSNECTVSLTNGAKHTINISVTEFEKLIDDHD